MWPREPPPSGVGVVPAAPPTIAVMERDNPLEIQAALETRPRDLGLLHGLFEALGRAAHALRGSAAVFGAAAFAEAAHEIEARCGAGDLIGIDELRLRLEREGHVLGAALVAFRAEQG